MFRAADELALRALRDAMHEYAPLTDATWGELAACCRGLRLTKGEFFCRLGAVPREFGFVVSGLLRCFVSDAEGNEYNKIFFEERSFPGPMAALLEGGPSAVALQALEDSLLVAIDFAGFRALLERSPDLMWFQIRYLERNWLLMKEPREFALVQDEAAQRYQPLQARVAGARRATAPLPYRLASGDHADAAKPHPPSRARRIRGLAGR
jgi:CRP-like cAMP-binding protein